MNHITMEPEYKNISIKVVSSQQINPHRVASKKAILQQQFINWYIPIYEIALWDEKEDQVYNITIALLAVVTERREPRVKY